MKIADLSFKKKSGFPENSQIFKDDFKYVSLEKQFTDSIFDRSEDIAVRDEYGTMTFGELDRFSANLARFILSITDGAETPIGLICGRSRWFAASALGILRAGAVYVPIDNNLPYSRKHEMLENCRTPLLIVEKATAGDGLKLLYDLEDTHNILCVNLDSIESAIELKTERLSRELWEQLSEKGPDASWVRMTTREPFSDEILESIADNVYDKINDKLGTDAVVLDIGSGSGKVAQRIASNCSKYVAIDLSRNELERIERQIRQNNPGSTVECHPYEALDISIFSPSSYDLIVMNSVTENFPGFNYTRAVLNSAIQLLKPDGVLFVGGVLNAEKRDILLAEISDYVAQTGDIRPLLQMENRDDNFIPIEFITDWQKSTDFPLKVAITPSRIKYPELSEYRYDIRIERVAASESVSTSRPSKQLFGKGVLEIEEGIEPGLFPDISEDRPAYIIFTSGSTGKPKGVVVSHGSLLNLAEVLHNTAYQPFFSNTPQEIALVASFSFDASLQQLILHFTRGHTLNIVSEMMKREQGVLADFYRKYCIKVSDMTPSLFSIFTDDLIEHKLSVDTGIFIIGGEKLTNKLLDAFYSIPEHSDTKIINAYGPTECCVDSTLHLFTIANYREHDIPPIGRPIRNTVIEVRDSNGKIVPDGIPGEFWIGGRGVAIEYLNDPTSTSQSFVDNSRQPQVKWYKSGDFGRRTSDGLFHFIGREDDQVKIGGYRIELGEVESALNKCPLVKEGVLKSVDVGGNGAKVLVAYIIPEGLFDVKSIRRYLQSVLPAHVIPSYFMEIEQFQYTSSGKVDRKKLPLPTNSKRSAVAEGRPLEGRTERKLAEIWHSLLGITVDDALADFFTLGGHSVLAVRLVSLVEKHFGIRIPLSKLFKSSTIENLATMIEKGDEGQKSWNPLVKISDKGDRPPVFFFHPVGGNVLCYQQLASSIEDEYPVYMLESAGVEGGEILHASVEEMVSFYLKFITREIPDGPISLAGWSFGGVLAVEAARQLDQQGRKISSLILLDSVAAKDKIKYLMQQDESGFLETMYGELLGFTAEEMRKLDSKSRLEKLMALGMEKGIFPSDFDSEKVKRLLKIFINNGLASAKYVFGKWSGSALLIRPETISTTALNVENDTFQGWEKIIQGDITLEWINGTHESMMLQPHINQVSKIVKRYLDQSTGEKKNES